MTGLEPIARHVLLVIASYVDSTGRAWPSVDTLAEITGRHPGSIRRALGQLPAVGVKVYRHPDRPTIYDLDEMAGVAQYTRAGAQYARDSAQYARDSAYIPRSDNSISSQLNSDAARAQTVYIEASAPVPLERLSPQVRAYVERANRRAQPEQE
jgi:hypothetical protein